MPTWLRCVGRAATGLLVASAVAAAGEPTLALDVRPVERSTVLLSGDVAELVPGTPGVLRVTVANPSERATSVRRVRAEVSAPVDRSGCTAGHLSVTEHDAVVRIPARGRRVVTLSVTLAADVPPACLGARWLLQYVAD